ncbi:hypothetical protein F1188_19650 [Roseospira marina]|uniref:Uncharacterized protein n=1 Tax=Roseospira marina TaxID=140057 RepID=A0A5M6I5I7_9PROT|nr:hypothetical protein [Roseospira marina]KAA5603491.1 hypothetical protein F1188_19650 [Roseospira marina]MBB4315481.1 hypothetical protein [Roseospira marina]MBB5088373.1 hypothetical protein [Roseospira marina]
MKIGDGFRYRGDEYAFATPFLRSRGAKIKKWLLPTFDDSSGMRAWTNKSFPALTPFVLIDIETKRKGAKGRDLADLYVFARVDDDGRKMTDQTGILIADINEKFMKDTTVGLTLGIKAFDDEGEYKTAEPTRIDVAAEIAANPAWGAF